MPNRYFLDQTLTRVWRRDLHSSRPLAVLMIDIDHFKLLNDRYGHPPAMPVCARWRVCCKEALVRPGDVLARYGGEEFIALVQDADAAGGQGRGRTSAQRGRGLAHRASRQPVRRGHGQHPAWPVPRRPTMPWPPRARQGPPTARCTRPSAPGRNQVRTLAADAA